MSGWKKYLVPALFALGSILSLILAVLKPFMKGEPVKYPMLAIAAMFLVFSIVSVRRKPVSGSPH